MQSIHVPIHMISGMLFQLSQYDINAMDSKRKMDDIKLRQAER